jgi:serine/threonine protein kinase
MTPISEGQILDEKYRIIRRIGEGGFGEVFLANDILLESRHVAIKSLKIDDANHEQSLIEEMKFLSNLANPHVITFYHHFYENEPSSL